MSKSVNRLFRIAIWLPAVVFLPLPVLESLFRGPQRFEDMLLTYGLSFGIIAYPIFAIWATRFINKKAEADIAKLIWWAPIIFIPFYGVPWVIYGLAHIVTGDISGIAMALLWITFSPYIIVVGYTFSIITFVIYKLFFNSASMER
jgi:hypothetical protein